MYTWMPIKKYGEWVITYLASIIGND